MQLKLSVAALCVASLTSMSVVNAASKGMSLQAQIDRLNAQVNALGQGGMGGLVGSNSAFSKSILSHQRDVNDVLRILKNRQDGMLRNTLTLGGKIKADAIYNHKSIDGSGSSNKSRVILNDAVVSIAAALNNYATAYMSVGVAELEPLQQFDEDQPDTISLRDAYLIIGNLTKSPFFGFVGKGNVSFGKFGTVNNMIDPVNRALFHVHGAEQLGVGFDHSGFSIIATVMNGGINGSNTYTTNSAHINNFAINASYGMTSGKIDWRIGGGYLNGSGFSNNDSPESRNGAWDLNAGLSVDKFDFQMEYTQTVDKVGSNKNSELKKGIMTLPTFSGSVLKAWNIAGHYHVDLMGKMSSLNLSYSQAQTGAANRMQQVVAGVRSEVFSNIQLGLSYAYNKEESGGTSKNTASSVILDAAAYF